MRLWLLVALALMVVGDSKTSAEEKNGDKQKSPKEAAKQTESKKDNRRTFQVTFDVTMEQKFGRGDVVMGDQTIPGRTVQKTHSTFLISDNEAVVLPSSLESSEDEGRRSSGDIMFEIKVKSEKDNLVRLLVTVKQSHTDVLKTGEINSWDLILKGAKTAKLQKTVKFEFGDEKTISTKCICEAVIEEKPSDKIKDNNAANKDFLNENIRRLQ